jgi:hypothetical protein
MMGKSIRYGLSNVIIIARIAARARVRLRVAKVQEPDRNLDETDLSVKGRQPTAARLGCGRVEGGGGSRLTKLARHERQFCAKWSTKSRTAMMLRRIIITLSKIYYAKEINYVDEK